MFRDINTLIAKIETIVNRAHDFRKSYFFTPPSSAYARRQYERANSCPVTEWEEDGHVERMQYYRMGGRKYTGEGIYKTLTDICMAAREKVCA